MNKKQSVPMPGNYFGIKAKNLNSKSVASLTSLNVDEIFNTDSTSQRNFSSDSSSSSMTYHYNSSDDLTSSLYKIRNQAVIDPKYVMGQTEFDEEFNKIKIHDVRINNRSFGQKKESKQISNNEPCLPYETQNSKKCKYNSIGNETRPKEIRQFDNQFDILYEDDNSTILSERSFIHGDFGIMHIKENRVKNEEAKLAQIIHSEKVTDTGSNNIYCGYHTPKSDPETNKVFCRSKTISYVEKGIIKELTKQKSPKEDEDTQKAISSLQRNSLKISEKIHLFGLDKQIKKVRLNLFARINQYESMNNISNISKNFTHHKFAKTHDVRGTNSLNLVQEKSPADVKQNLINLYSTHQTSFKNCPKRLFSNIIIPNYQNNQIIRNANEKCNRNKQEQNHNFSQIPHNFSKANTEPSRVKNVENFSNPKKSINTLKDNKEEVFAKSLNKELCNPKFDVIKSNEEYDPSVMLKIKVKVKQNEDKEIVFRTNDDIDKVIEDFCERNELDIRLKAPLVKRAKEALICITNVNISMCKNKDVELRNYYSETKRHDVSYNNEKEELKSCIDSS